MHLISHLIAVAVGFSIFHVNHAFSSTGSSLDCHTCLQLKRDDHNDSIDTAPADPIRRRRLRNLEHWGVVNHSASHQHQQSLPVFPATFDEVADEVFHAIAGTICGLQRPDPNVASNAMHQSVLDYRPTHPKWASERRWVDGDDSHHVKDGRTSNAKDIARMGIEIDGAAHLSSSYSNDEGRAMRLLSLQIAKRLSNLPWDEMESSSGFRFVAVYYNSLEQSLLASQELSRLKEEEGTAESDDCFDHIHILSLGQDSLPPSMTKEKTHHNHQKNKDGYNTPGDRIILVVKPTDYDTGSVLSAQSGTSPANKHHPTLQANIVDKLQSLLFQASASDIPAVVLSPRLSELPPLQQSSAETYKRTGPSGFEQSGFQKSATYGGIEPPVGPTSWLLRDLIPPVYVWVGCASTIGKRRKSPSFESVAASLRQQHNSEETNFDGNTDETTLSFYSGISLTQSAMETGHAWHMFAVKEELSKPIHSTSPSRSMARGTHSLDQVERHVSYHYMGSSNASRGRPSSRIMNDVFEEFCETMSGE